MRFLGQLGGADHGSYQEENEAIKLAMYNGLSVALSVGALLWSAICVFFEWWIPALIPLSYAILSLLNYLVYRRTRNTDRHMSWQVGFSIFLPFLFQFVLGGWQNAGLVMLWSLIPLVVAIAYRGGKASHLWTFGTILFIGISFFWDPGLNTEKVDQYMSPLVQKNLMAMNFFMIFIILTALARFFIQSLEQSRSTSFELRDDLAARNNHLETSLNYAERIQSAMTPSLDKVQFVLDDQFQLIKQKEEVGGDMIWVGHEGDHVMIALIDCTGHGVPGSMLTVLVNDIMNEAVHFTKFTEAKDIVLRLMLSMHERLKSSAEIWTDNADLGVLSFNKKTGQIDFSGCGINLLACSSSGMEIIKGQNTILGLKQLCDRPQEQVNLKLDKAGTSLYLASDGVTDLFGGPKHERFGSQRYLGMIERVKDMPFDLQKQIISEELQNWKGANKSATDDISVIGLGISKAFLAISGNAASAESA